MATARELLDEADALMRKNRGGMASDIPVLTDVVTATPSPLEVLAEDIPVLTESVAEANVSVPLPGPTVAVAAMFEGDPSDWLVMDTIDPALDSITGKGPDTLAVVPPVMLKVSDPASDVAPPIEPEAPTRATHKAAGSAPTPPPARSNAPESVAAPAVPDYDAPPAATQYVASSAAPESLAPPAAADHVALPVVSEHSTLPVAAEYAPPTMPSAPVENERADTDSKPATPADERWHALAEQISMQVLQRIDLFTDTGLKEQLARHLQPIVDRASAELVGEINDQVGKLVRSYIAEAIEREIAQWRSEHH